MPNDHLFPVYLVHGSLGAGKTSLVKHLLAHSYFQHSIIIENEFASENVDTETLSSHAHTGHVHAISGGCICCTSGEEFMDVLRTLPKTHPEQVPVIIETTGVASSIQLLQQLFMQAFFHDTYKLAHNILVVDALETDDASLSTLALDIKLADFIVVNKSDAVSAKQLDSLLTTLRSIDPSANVVTVTQGAVDIDSLLAQKTSHVEQHLIEHMSAGGNIPTATHTAAMRYRVIELQAIEPGELRRRVEHAYCTYGVLRIKGRFHDTAGATWHIESTPHGCELVASAPIERPKVVVIGHDVPADILQNNI